MTKYSESLLQAERALIFLADHDRPQGGNNTFNAEHLLMIADDIKNLKIDILKTVLAICDEQWYNTDIIGTRKPISYGVYQVKVAVSRLLELNGG